MRFDWVSTGPGEYLASPLFGGTLISVVLTGLAISARPPDRQWKVIALLATAALATIALVGFAALIFLVTMFGSCWTDCRID